MSSLASPTIVGADIGGANLKLSDTTGRCVSRAFPMWLEHQHLGQVVRNMLTATDWINLEQVHLALTLTGELADCYATRRQGVKHIIESISSAVPTAGISVYGVDGTWYSAEDACLSPWTVAASNWHALANWICKSQRFSPSTLHAIVDIGSTTTDIIPLVDAQIATTAQTDRQRMQLSQLVYTGMERTPLAMVLSEVSLAIDDPQVPIACPLMAERFATMDDVYLVLGLTPEQSHNCDTADGRPRDIQSATARLARMIGEDAETLSSELIGTLATQALDAQARRVAAALDTNLRAAGCVGSAKILLTGHGTALFRQAQVHSAFSIETVALSDILSPEAARVAPALAAAQLCSMDRAEQHA
ncbi:hydantoinase/oxoprolinase family protein [Aureliella helgolandensis]|uniref:Hydantoinase/oxoprolinase n=1 Tax=Aureliella helgolandensis TaxID=2527968 RepID=A0A518G7B4_9BACT|nr:hydantoinase/oxoprolinase family protein [Aureliella helgolandensis]QDV24478.1 Hydantoinase/oxoprolinase [Aureliella helgolandensis]